MPIGFDRLLYPIAKKLKWHHPDFYGPAKLATMLGALQTEMVMLGCLGDWLQDSGWTIALSNSGVTTSGNNSLLSGHGLAATKFVHEVTACTLYDLMKQANQQSKCDTGRKQRYLTFEQWREQMELLTRNFIFGQFHLRCKWIMLFLRSTRSQKFSMYVHSRVSLYHGHLSLFTITVPGGCLFSTTAWGC